MGCISATATTKTRCGRGGHYYDGETVVVHCRRGQLTSSAASGMQSESKQMISAINATDETIEGGAGGVCGSLTTIPNWM
jgi:hypothetical protein